MMTSAGYGHMDGGHCIGEVDPRYRGCVDDVLPLFDRWCSGKQECNFDTGVSDLKDTNINCPKFTMKFTRVHHSCIKVKSMCSSRTLTDTAGYLSSYIADTRRCGSLASPWKISADPGQIIQLEMTDFSFNKHNSNIISCRSIYGFVLERSLGINQTICGGSKRQVALYISKTNEVEIQFLKSNKRGEGEFLVKYQVVGCSEMSPPPNAWYKREGNKAVIGCENNDKEWTVTCTGNRMRQETKRAALVHKTYSTLDRNIQTYYRPVTMDQSVDNRTLWDIPPPTHPEGHTMSSDDQCTCATLQMRNNVDSDKRTEMTSLERQSLYSSIKSN
ncbi:hypothetical protein LSH36_122g09055 [Paralvinella palmiformis]|uniref:CUB domain-containing protein n=1 Tax=Paralvinella palmiformis TaxID=53620 RepID=A0AAD9NA45_9ANNE|nr:hypothetical protein LSH36_122g09055 [Paralvinella palmiformis]